MSKQEFTIEDSILEQNSEYLGSLELPIGKKVFIGFFVVAAFLALVILGKILFLSSIAGAFYSNRSDANVGKQIILPALRGIVYDRFGKPLVDNEPASSLFLNLIAFKKHGYDPAVLAEKAGRVLGTSPEELLELLRAADLEKKSLLLLAKDLTSREIISIQSLKIEALEIQNDYFRHYLRGAAFSPVLGYTGLPQFRDSSGKTGLEAYYNDELSGNDGIRLVYKDAKGNVMGEKLLSNPENGSDLHLTIDAELQEYFYTALKNKLRELGRNVGVGIALDPRSGEVLALVNVPTYDNNAFTKSEDRQGRLSALNNPFQPLFNRAVSGAYSPGSTIKPLVAVAALKEGVIDAKKQIFSAGFIEIPNPYFPDKPSIFYDWKPNGWVDLYSAIAKSSNIYFYAVGGGYEEVKGLGIEKLKEYWQKFGFGKKSGIDLDSEGVGFLPDPELKKKIHNDNWRLGDTYNVSIGQGDLLLTPIQLINYIAAIGNGGKLYQPYIVSSVKRQASSDKLVKRSKLIRDLSFLEPEIKEAQKAMRDAVSESYGSSNRLADLPMAVSAKTGTAQISGNTKINAFLVGYASVDPPASGPEIAVLVLIENAKEGSVNAIPVAKDVLNWYYWNRLASRS